MPYIKLDELQDVLADLFEEAEGEAEEMVSAIWEKAVALPRYEARPAAKAYWIPFDKAPDGNRRFGCSICGHTISGPKGLDTAINFCCTCGADMRRRLAFAVEMEAEHEQPKQL